jgi:hypothetical protein
MRQRGQDLTGHGDLNLTIRHHIIIFPKREFILSLDLSESGARDTGVLPSILAAMPGTVRASVRVVTQRAKET